MDGGRVERDEAFRTNTQFGRGAAIYGEKYFFTLEYFS
jgi:hypothetical protein